MGSKFLHGGVECNVKVESRRCFSQRILPSLSATFVLRRVVSARPACGVCCRLFQGTLDTERKFAAGENKSSHRGHMNMKKLDDETEEFQRELFLSCVPVHVAFFAASCGGRERALVSPRNRVWCVGGRFSTGF